MLTERLAARCASAEVVSTALVEDFNLAFSKRSKDQSGKATLVQDSDSIVYGVLFRIEDKDLVELDSAEGAGKGYERFTVSAKLAIDDRIIEAYSYIATDIDSTLKPYNWYKALVLAGALQHGLPGLYRQNIVELEAIDDTDLDRRERRKAITILEQAGFKHLIEK